MRVEGSLTIMDNSDLLRDLEADIFAIVSGEIFLSIAEADIFALVSGERFLPLLAADILALNSGERFLPFLASDFSILIQPYKTCLTFKSSCVRSHVNDPKHAKKSKKKVKAKPRVITKPVPVDPIEIAKQQYVDEMIEYITGKLGSEITPDDTATAKAVMSQIMGELAGEGESGTLDQLWEVDFHRRPPSVREFMESSEYLGDILSPNVAEGENGLYKKWKEAFVRDFSTPGVQQVILSGAIGLGKTWFAVSLVLYKLCFCLCLKKPHAYFGISSASAITLSFFSITQKQVMGGIFGDCVKFIRTSPFFCSHIHDTVKTRKYSDRRIEFSNGDIIVEAGSQLSEAIGRNVLVSVIDEINFRREKDAAKAAHELVESVNRRMKSRFRDGDSHPGLLVLISSAKDADDFLVGHMEQNRHNKSVRIYDYAWWEVVGPYKHTYSGKKFIVDTGDSMSLPRILDDEAESADIPPSRLIHVPIEHEEEFRADLTGAIRDVAGRATGRSAKLFGQLLPLLNCIDDELLNPFRVDSVPQSIEVSVDPIQSYINIKDFLRWHDGKGVPKRHQMAERYIHIDMSTGAQDAMGITMIHRGGVAVVAGFDPRTHRSQAITRPVWEIDFAIRIIRDPKRQDVPLDFGRVREFICWLRLQRFPIAMVSCDLRELSAEMRAILKHLNFNTEYLSVDKKKDQYYQLRQTVLEGRLKMPDLEYLLLELQHLEDVTDKVDHPETFPTVKLHGQTIHNLQASKDLSDGLAGALWFASQADVGTLTSDPHGRAEALNTVTQQRQEGTDEWVGCHRLKDKIKTM